MTVEHTDVLVVGAGPTGLTAACRLARLGVPHVVVDAAAAPATTSRAALVHAATLEILADLGPGDALVAAGRVIRRIVMVEGARPLLHVAFDALPSRYPFALGVPQSTTESLLLGLHLDLGGSVRRGHRVTALVPAGDGHLVTGVAGPSGRPFAVRARYVVGADGSHSAVRAAAGIGFPGASYPSQFVLADVALDADTPDDEATIALSPAGVTVLARLPGGEHRIVATVDAAADVPEAPDRRYVEDLLQARGVAATTTAEPAWSSRFRVHHRVADRFRVGTVFLAGDAAHVHSPAAGQGMNTGIADAYDLAGRLADTVAGDDPAVLDGYDTARRAAALEVVRFTDRMTRMATLRSPAARAARRVGAGTVGRLAPVRARVAMWVTGLERSPLRTGISTRCTPHRPGTPRP